MFDEKRLFDMQVMLLNRSTVMLQSLMGHFVVKSGQNRFRNPITWCWARGGLS